MTCYQSSFSPIPVGFESTAPANVFETICDMGEAEFTIEITYILADWLARNLKMWL